MSGCYPDREGSTPSAPANLIKRRHQGCTWSEDAEILTDKASGKYLQLTDGKLRLLGVRTNGGR